MSLSKGALYLQGGTNPVIVLRDNGDGSVDVVYLGNASGTVEVSDLYNVDGSQVSAPALAPAPVAAPPADVPQVTQTVDPNQPAGTDTPAQTQPADAAGA